MTTAAASGVFHLSSRYENILTDIVCIALAQGELQPPTPRSTTFYLFLPYMDKSRIPVTPTGQPSGFWAWVPLSALTSIVPPLGTALGTVRMVPYDDDDQAWGPNWPGGGAGGQGGGNGDGKGGGLGTPTAATVPTTAAAGSSSSSVAAEGKEGEKGSNKGKVDEGKPAEAPTEGAPWHHGIPWDPEYGFDGGGDAVGAEGHEGEGSDERPRKVIKITCSFEIHLE